MGQKGGVHASECAAHKKRLYDLFPAVRPRSAAAVDCDAAAALLDYEGITLAYVENPDTGHAAPDRQETDPRAERGAKEQHEAQCPLPLLFGTRLSVE